MTTAVNNPRGETLIDLGARKVRLRMTLEGMAALEDLLKIDTLANIGESEVLARPSSSVIGGIIVILAKGAGEVVPLEEARKAPIALEDLFAKIGEAMGVRAEPAAAPNA